MDFGEILSRAWQTIWKHKVLWVFGILAGCTSSTSSWGSNSGYRFREQEFPLAPRIQTAVNQLPAWEIVLIVSLIVLAILLLVVIFVVLGTFGRIGLVKGTQMADKGQERLNLGELFSYSGPFFWRVFALNLVVGLVIAIALIVLGVAGLFFAVVTVGFGLLCLIPLFCLLVPIMWVVSVIVEQANIALIVEDLSIGAALSRGWEVVKTNIGNYIVMALILLVIGVVVSLVTGLPLAAVFSPVLVGALVGTRQALGTGVILGLACFVVYVPILILLNGILRAYIEAAWTLTYLRLTAPKAPAAPLEPTQLPETS